MLSLLVPPLRTNEHPCRRDLLVALPHADFPDLQGYEWKRAADSALGFVPVPHSTSSIAAVTQFNKMLRLFVPQARHMMESDDEELEFGVKRQSLTWVFLEFSCSTWAFRSQMQKKRTGTVCVFSNPCSSRHRVFVILMMQWFVSFSVSLTPLGIAQRFKQATWTVWIFVYFFTLLPSPMPHHEPARVVTQVIRNAFKRFLVQASTACIFISSKFK